VVNAYINLVSSSLRTGALTKLKLELPVRLGSGTDHHGLANRMISRTESIAGCPLGLASIGVCWQWISAGSH